MACLTTLPFSLQSLAGAVSARLLVGGAHPDAATAPKGEDALRAADAVGAVSVGALLERAAACLGEVQDRLAEQAREITAQHTQRPMLLLILGACGLVNGW